MYQTKIEERNRGMKEKTTQNHYLTPPTLTTSTEVFPVLCVPCCSSNLEVTSTTKHNNRTSTTSNSNPKIEHQQHQIQHHKQP
jgi:hypothetical protein